MYCPNPECPDADPKLNPPEYVAGVEVCAKCHSRLVAQRPWEPGVPGPRGHWHDFVTVASFINRLQAHLVCGGLRWRGVDAVVMDENLISTYWQYAIAIGGVKVRVPVEDAADARAALAEDWSLQPGDVDYSDDESCYPPCPECSSCRIHHHQVSWLSLFPALFFSGMVLPLPSNLLICESCGRRWRAKHL